MITCTTLLTELSNYLDGEVDAELRAELEAHLRACPGCLVLYDTTRRTILVFRGTEPYPMPEEVKVRLAAAIHRRLEK